MISVIVPVYKVEQYLHRCVDSILVQSYNDFELLLINDGSPDGSGIICEEYAAKDSRVRVFHRENGGVSSARNVGLDNARGEWITFIDADDWIEPDFLLMLYGNFDSDMIIGSVKTTDGQTWRMDDRVCNTETFIKEFINTPLMRAPWGSLLRLDIINNNDIRFDSLVRYGEDMIFNMKYLLYCKSVRLLNYCGYNYYQVLSSTTKKYVLTQAETIYSINETLSAKEKLNIKFGIQLSNDIDYMVYLGLWPINEMVDDTYLEDYYKLYNSMNPSSGEMSFYNDKLFSPIIRGISEMKVYYQNKMYDKWMKLCESIHSISLKINYKLNFPYNDFYIWYWLIKNRQYQFLSFILSIYLGCKAIVYSMLKKK